MPKNLGRNILIFFVLPAAATVAGNLLSPPVHDASIAVWHFLLRFLAFMWSVLTWSVPLWAVLALVGATVLLTRRRRPEPKQEPLPRRAFAEELIAGEAPSPPPTSLDGLEERMIRELALADGGSLDLTDFSNRTRESRLRCEKAAERLITVGLVEAHLNHLYPTSYGLTSAGRDYVLKNGYA